MTPERFIRGRNAQEADFILIHIVSMFGNAK